MVKPVPRIELGHSGVLDADLFGQLGDPLLKPFTLGFQAYPGIDAVGCPPMSVGHPELGQGNDVQHGRLDVIVPASWQGDLGRVVLGGHSSRGEVGKG